MVSQVGLNQSLVNNSSLTTLPTTPVNNTLPANNSLFQPQNTSLNNYSNDFMIQNLDFNAMAAGIYPQPNTTVQTDLAQIPQNIPQIQNQTVSQQAVPAFSGNNNINTAELEDCLTQRDPNIVQTANGNPYRKTYVLTKTGAVAGLAAPVAVKGFELFKAGNLKNLFKSKSLLVSCPLVAAAGLGIGWLLDGYINSKRAQKADVAVQPQTTTA